MGLRNYGLPPTRWPSIDYHPLSGFTQHLDDETICLGFEATPESYIGHLVLVFRELWRILRNDGCAFLNVGDSYAAGKMGRGDIGREFAGSQTRTTQVCEIIQRSVPPGLKPKDLMMIPARVALALESDGWYLRSDIIWAKGASGQQSVWKNVYNTCLGKSLSTIVSKEIADSADPFVGNPMPESCQDRPSRSHEYFFMLTKSGSSQFWTHPTEDGVRERPEPDYIWIHEQTGKIITTEPTDPESWKRKNLWEGHDYYYDAGSVMEECSTGDPRRPYGSQGMWEIDGRLPEKRHGGEPRKQDLVGKNTYTGFNDRYIPVAKRSLRDTWSISTKAYPVAHFATFSPDLIEIPIKAGSSERGCCPKCGAPWTRVVEKKVRYQGHSAQAGRTADDLLESGKWRGNNRGENIKMGPVIETVTTGWHPTCSCDLEPVPCLVLDPFGGSGTVAKVCQELGRDSIYVDLNPEYVQMAMNRVGRSLFSDQTYRKVEGGVLCCSPNRANS